MPESTDKPTVSPLLYFSGAAVFAALIWGWFLLEQFTNLRVTGASGHAAAEPLPIIAPLITTPVAFVVALVLWRRAAGIAANAVPVTATVVSVGGEVQSMRDVAFAYSFEGREYTKKMSVTVLVSNELEPGGTLEIVVDKRNPKRVMLR